MTRVFYALILTFFLANIAFAQAPTQTVRGKVYDSETNFGLIGAKLEIKITPETSFRAVTDADGNFEMKKVPVGKYQITALYAMYESKTLTVEINSGRELIINIPMTELIAQKSEVTVSANKKRTVLNEMATISAQQFSVEETNRYPGSRMDPARMASNFAGVQGADDSRNDIVIRGNSPLGVVWRVEGIDIPNPSHFAISGSTGGPVSVLNNKSLSNSDFFMSAFPAEYGNSTSGVFDLKLRNGNSKQHEFTGQFGFLGTELLAEGPLSKNGKSSYLVMGRYSTLALFQKIGVKIGTDAVPVYGDGAFKFNFQLKKGGQLSLFGIGGKSKISIMISEQTEYSKEFYGEGDRDQYFGTSMFVSGLNYKKSLNEKTYIAATLAYSIEEQHSTHNYLQRSLDTNAVTNAVTIRVDTMYRLMSYQFKTNKMSAFFSVNHKFNKQHLIKFGINTDAFFMNQLDSALKDVSVPNDFAVRWDYKGSAFLIQPFVQWKWRVNDNFDVTAGLHSQYFTLSNSISPVEPRMGMKYRMKGNQSIFMGAGMHSQMQPLYTYTYHQTDNAGNYNYQNKNMDFMRSVHTGIGYEKSIAKAGLNIRTEAYYQYLYNVPVTVQPSSFSIINMGSGFARIFPDALQNTGTGFNYGLELTVQKYFDKSFFFLFSGTLYDSKYYGSDGILRNTSYNGKYVANLLIGKEFKIGAKNVLGIGTKITVAGGKRYGLVDIARTEALKEIIFQDSLYNDLQFKDYFRMDLKISWRMNANKVTHEIGLDLVNIFNTKNLLSLAYAPSLNPSDTTVPGYQPTAQKTQLGFLPIFYYKIDFKVTRKE